MKILFVVPYVPNLIRVRPYNLIRNLTRLGHQVTVVTLWSDDAERASIEELESHCHQVIALQLPRWRSLLNVATALPTGKPLQSVYCWQPALAEKLQELLLSSNGAGPFDVVHIEHLRGSQYGLYLRSLLRQQKDFPPIVWDSVDSISHLFRQASSRSKSIKSRAITWFELGRTERYEGWLVDQFDHTLVTSPIDKQALLSLGNNHQQDVRVDVLSNGVDLKYFSPDPSVERDPATLIISGKMSYHANVTMVLRLFHEIMPLVWARKSDVKLLVVGKDPTKEILSLRDHPNVTVTGTVKDLPPYLRKATIALAPIDYGAGVQNKVLEAMACGTPVVASSKAVSALDVEPDRDILVAEDVPNFAHAVSSLLEEPEMRERIGEAGRCYVERHHDWFTIAKDLVQIYKQAIDRSQSV